jgi:hypothetical protein
MWERLWRGHRTDLSKWNPTDEASRRTLLHLQTWARRDMYWHGSFALIFLTLAGWGVYSALHGSPWSWITVVFEGAMCVWYVRRTIHAFDNFVMLDTILKPYREQPYD